MDYFLGAIIGALIITWLITRIINKILKKKFKEKKAIVVSFFISVVLVLIIGSFNFGIVKSFFIYVPFLIFWLIIDKMNADINE